MVRDDSKQIWEALTERRNPDADTYDAEGLEPGPIRALEDEEGPTSNLDNLIGIVDRNNIQQCGFTEDIMAIDSLKHKWESFGWSVCEIDGHNMQEILETFSQIPFNRNKPSLVISNTIKGKGISFMENDNKWHGGGAIKDFSDEALEEVKRFSKNVITKK